VWREQGKFDAARTLLHGLLLTSARKPSILSASLHELAQLTATEVQPVDVDWFAKNYILNQFPDRSDQQLLLDLAQANTSRDTTDLAEGLTVLDQFTANPRDIVVTANYDSVSVAKFIEEVRQKTGLTIELNERLLPPLQARTQRIVFRELSLATVLDALLEPGGLCWTVADNDVRVLPMSEWDRLQLQAHRMQQALRICQRAVTLFPDAQQTLTTSLCLGNLSFWTGNHADAVGAYREVLRRSQQAGIVTVVSFNEAKAFLFLDQRRAAEESLFRTIDSARGQSLEAVGYTYLGKLFLEAWQLDNATRHLARGLSLARDPETERVAAVTLAAAYLLSGNTQTANQTLHDHRTVLNEEPSLSQAAFLSALARYRVAGTSLDEVQRGRQLANALGSVEPGRFFSDAGILLIAQAYQEIGLTDQQEFMLRSGLESMPPSVMRQEVQMSLARHLQDAVRWREAHQAYQVLVDADAGLRTRQAKIGLAEIAFATKSFDECLRRCYGLVNDTLTTEQKTSILRLMGGVFEAKQMHSEAALCFAGMVPAPPREVDMENTTEVRP
jgi:tetratricopeptide (TPR) repeat protein